MTQRDFKRLNAFLNERLKDIYPEQMGNNSEDIIRQMIPSILQHHNIPANATVLDVGCGTGLALEVFQQHGCMPTGIGFGAEAATAREKGFNVIEQDMSFLDVDNDEYQIVWCRHVLEHSIFPFFTLSEMFRITKPGGIIYVEVPMPDTSSHHESNQNHYSVMGVMMWAHLLRRVGFEDIRNGKVEFTTPAGNDAYTWFDGRKSRD